MLTLVCATANPHKVAEIGAILGAILGDVVSEGRALRIELLPRPADVGDIVEDAGTLEGNARLKATAIARATGMPALADDTGLFVHALDGRPGVETAYFAGPTATDADNRARMLRELDGVTDRRAEFRTVAMVVWPDGREVSAVGTVQGTLAEHERGDGGFGYDPLFIPDEAPTGTFAELGPDVKQRLSHRSRAVRALVEALVAG